MNVYITEFSGKEYEAEFIGFCMTGKIYKNKLLENPSIRIIPLIESNKEKNEVVRSLSTIKRIVNKI